jgi:hypothetical protein
MLQKAEVVLRTKNTEQVDVSTVSLFASLFEPMAGTNIEEGERANGAACNGK